MKQVKWVDVGPSNAVGLEEAGPSRHWLHPPQRRCLTVEEMVALGMAQNAKGWWQIPTRVKAVAGIMPGETCEDEEEEEQEVGGEREVA